jgi:hypothetical protein
MVLPILTAFLLGQQNVRALAQFHLPNPWGKKSRLLVQYDADQRLNPPKLSPKWFGDPPYQFEFDYFTGGYASIHNDEKAPLRFRVYEQQRKETNDLSVPVTWMLLRLWEYNFNRLKIDHSSKYNTQMDDVYLCWGGKPGGEQLFDTDHELAVNQSVNTIYIYDLPSFKEPVEMAREVAHEYGHASLYPMGGFETPEDWGNGYLGEKLFLTYLRDEIVKGELTPADAMGATGEELDKWVKANVDPLIAQAASAPPNVKLLGGKGQAAMNAYIGLTLYCSQLFSDDMFQNSMKFVGSESAKDIPQAIMLAVEGVDEFQINIPACLAGRSIWIPVSKAKVKGATVLSTREGWDLIKPLGKTVTLVNQPSGH